MASSPFETVDPWRSDRQDDCFVCLHTGWEGFLLQVRNQIDAMQLEHDHKRMMFNNASAALILRFPYGGEPEKRRIGGCQPHQDQVGPHSTKDQVRARARSGIGASAPMKPKKPDGPAMTLGNMRELGVRHDRRRRAPELA